jgi:hypothetical protein
MGVGVEMKHNAFLISTLDGSELHAPVALLPRKEFPVPTGYETCRVAELASTCRKVLVPAGNGTPSIQPTTLLTELRNNMGPNHMGTFVLSVC